jgi:hypothetical protein
MSRVLLAILACLCILSVTGGAVAHAAEPVGCIDSAEAALMGHSSGDADQVPADADKGVPHHHGGCHSHHVCDAVSDQSLSAPISRSNGHFRISADLLAASHGPPALRPPIA